MSRSKPARVIEHVHVDHIDIPMGRRKPVEKDVNALKDSLASIGLQAPITLREPAPDTEHGYQLVAGHHRLLAARALGWEKIEAVVLAGCTDAEAQMIEIAENLHRAELTQLERAKQVLKWMELRNAVQSAHNAPIESKRDDGRGHRPASGINAAARDLRMERTDIQRSMKVGGLSGEAQEAAREAGLDDNRTALLAAAKETEPAKQVEVLKQRAAKPKAAPKATNGVKPPADMGERCTAEAGWLIVTHMSPPDMIGTLLKNLEFCPGCDGIVEAIKTAQAKKR